MRRIRFGVGMTLDAFIADDQGATNFLVSDPTYDSAPFVASIDSVIMAELLTQRRCARACGGIQD